MGQTSTYREFEDKEAVALGFAVGDFLDLLASRELNGPPRVVGWGIVRPSHANGF